MEGSGWTSVVLVFLGHLFMYVKSACFGLRDHVSMALHSSRTRDHPNSVESGQWWSDPEPSWTGPSDKECPPRAGQGPAKAAQTCLRPHWLVGAVHVEGKTAAGVAQSCVLGLQLLGRGRSVLQRKEVVFHPGSTSLDLWTMARPAWSGTASPHPRYHVAIRQHLQTRRWEWGRVDTLTVDFCCTQGQRGLWQRRRALRCTSASWGGSCRLCEGHSS